MGERFEVGQATELLEFLSAALPGWSRNTLRQRLELGCVAVNGEVVRLARHALAAGDEVRLVARDQGQMPGRAPRFTPLFQDADLVAIDKPAGLLSVSSADERERTALAQLRTELSAHGRPLELWPVHRLDRETSGVLLFARSATIQSAVQSNWEATRKFYLAVVEGRPQAESGTLEEPLWEDRILAVRVGGGPGAKAARTLYRVLRSKASRSLLEVELDTGRRHQIRVHLAHLGHPVVGDARYGQAGGRLGLHALRLELSHPVDGSPLRLEAPPPKALLALL